MITDEMLTQAAAELANAINESLPAPEECNHHYSTRFARKIKRLIYKANHPIQHRILRSVASILLVVLLGLSAVLAVNVEAREVFFGWIREQYESFYEYFFEGQPTNGEPASYYPEWMPDGYEYEATFEIDGGEILIFVNPAGAIAQFSYSTSPETLGIFMESVDCEHRTVVVNGLNCDIYIPYDSSLASEIVWISNDRKTFFSVSASVDPDVLLRIVEQLEAKK